MESDVAIWYKISREGNWKRNGKTGSEEEMRSEYEFTDNHISKMPRW